RALEIFHDVHSGLVHFVDTAEISPSKMLMYKDFSPPLGSWLVPYKGGPPMVTDLLGGHLPLASDLLSNFIALAREQKVRLLAVATAKRMSELPDAPTMQELMHAPFEAAAWFAILARAGTPADIVQKINAVTNRYLASPKGKELIARQALEAGGGTPADAAAFIQAELAKWEPVIRGANIALD